MRAWCVLMTAMIAVPAMAAEPMQAGLAVVNITPPVGYRLSGYFYERLSTGVHDPLLAKALVLRQGDTQAALVFCDLVGVPASVSGKVRKTAAEKTGIPAENIAVLATHTHTGPLYFGAMRQYLHEQAVAKHGRDPQETVDYAEVLARKLVEVISSAQSALRPVELRAGKREQKPQISFNRRYHMKDGSVRFNPGQGNPEIVRAAGPIDPEVGMIWIYPSSGYGQSKASLRNMGEQGGDTGGAERQPLATLTMFAMHTDTTGGTEYSADYPYYLEGELRAALGSELISLFGLATCGNVNDVDVAASGRKGAAKLGAALAATVLAARETLEPIAAGPLAVRSRRLEIPMPQYPPEKIREAAANMAKIGTKEMPFLEQVETYRITDLQHRGGKVLPLEVQVFRIGDVAIVALPGEPFVDLGLAIKRESQFKNTFVLELANEAPGYIPTRKAFAEGSYETVNSRIEPGGGELLVEAAVGLLRELAN